MRDILISIKPKYVEAILRGEKTVELRRRCLRVPEGTRVWVYSTLPDAKVRAVARIEQLDESSPENVWHANESKMFLTKTEYDEYIRGCLTVCVIHLADVQQLSTPLSLESMRTFNNLPPPQFFKFLDSNSVLVQRFLKCIG